MKYFAIIDDKQCGPYSLNELVEAGVGPNTYVWCKGMTDWKQAREVADICRYFRNRIFDLMHPKQSNTEQTTPVDSPEKLTQPQSSVQRFPEIADMIETNRIHENIDIPPRTWLIEAILLTILCFPPTGFMSIYFALKATKAWKEGKKKESHEYARKAKMWCGFTFFFGLIFYAFSSKFLI